MRLTQLTQTDDTPFLDLNIVKSFLHIEHDEDDVILDSLIEVAAQHIEGRHGCTGSQFREAQFKLDIDGAPLARWELPLNPIISVEEISCLDVDGNPYIIEPDDYKVITQAYIGYVDLNEYHINNYTDYSVVYTSGYQSIPRPVQHAAMLLVGHYYENREATVQGTSKGSLKAIPMGVTDLLAPYSYKYNYHSVLGSDV